MVDPAILQGYEALGRRAPTLAALRLDHHNRPLSIAEQISDRISERIIRGEIGAGTWLREQAIAEQFQVSRGPVREAFRLLENDGVLAIHANRGAQVSELSRDELWQVGYISNALAEPTQRVAAERMDDAARKAFMAAARRIAAKAKVYSDFELAVDIATLGLWTDRLGVGTKVENLSRALFRQTLRYQVLGLREKADRLEAADALLNYARALVEGDATKAAKLIMTFMGRINRRALDRRVGADDPPLEAKVARA